MQSRNMYQLINASEEQFIEYETKEALKLKGVKQFKLNIAGQDRTDFIANLHGKLDQAMTMVFVNRKDTALEL